MNERSKLPGVRNPVLSLPTSRKFLELPPEAKAALRAVLMELSDDARWRAETSWRKHKGPMAVYWKAVAVYSKHMARVMK